MQSNRSRDTSLEWRVRKELFRRGFRYRVSCQPIRGLPRKADVVFTRLKLAIFLDGCFWHCCPEHFKMPKSNLAYWGVKLPRNQERDVETNNALASQGWTVLRFWEHDETDKICNVIEKVVHNLRMGRIPSDPDALVVHP